MLFSSEKKESTLIIDIGNGSVGGALALVSRNNKPHIVFSTRSVFAFEEKPTGERLESAVFRSLERVVSEIMTMVRTHPDMKDTPKRLDRVLCVLSSPWFISQGKTITITQDKKFIITERFLKDVLTKEFEDFEQSTHDDSDPSGKKICIEKNVISIRVNGYVLENPLGQKANELEASIYMSESSEAFINSLMSIISKQAKLDSSSITFHTFTSVVLTALTHMFIGVKEFLHFDVAGEITDITLVKGGMIKNTVSYPTGTNLLVRKISKRLSVPNQVARSYIHVFMDNRAEASLHKEIQDALSECENEWNVYLNDALLTLTPEAQGHAQDQDKPKPAFGIGQVSYQDQAIDLPKKVFITAYPRTFELFNQFLKMEKTDETGTWRKDLDITYIGENILMNFVDQKNTQEFDAFLAVEALFASKNIS